MLFRHIDEMHDFEIVQVVVAGWTGRNRDAVEHHIQELAELGIAPPSQTPLFYRVSDTCLVQSDTIQVLGDTTSGEAEPLLLRCDGVLWLGLASDHTDRELEAVSVAASKQACPKPVSGQLWKFDEICDHASDLILRCHILENDKWVLYQEGTLAQILPLRELVDRVKLPEGSAMLCGTLPAIGSIRSAAAYRMELFDSRRDKSIRLDYQVMTLPVVA